MEQQPSRSGENSPSFAERHYTIAEIGGLWGLSKDSVRRIFQNETGVLVLGRKNVNGVERQYRTVRVPESVLERVHRKLCLGSLNENR
jgi:hypothetical protein